MATRDDHVITVSYPDGTTVVEHSDGTRITVYYRDTQVPVGEDTSENGELTGKLQVWRFLFLACRKDMLVRIIALSVHLSGFCFSQTQWM